MATYVNDLRLKEIGTGESSGTWGTETNTNLELIGEALGFGTEAITTNADTHTTTVADGSTDPGRAMYIKYTGTLDSACTITIAPNTMSRMHFIENGTSGSQNIIISQGTGANVTIPAGDVKAVYLDGAGSGAAVVDAFASLSTVDLKVQDDLTVTDDASVGGDLLVSGELQTANIGFTDGDNAITISDGGSTSFAQKITADAGIDIDNINIDGTTIALSSGDLTIDAAADIIFDAAGDNFAFKCNGTEIFDVQKDSNNAELRARISDGDLVFKGNDGGSSITALTLDMSENGHATFRAGAVFNESSLDSDFRVESNGQTHALFVDGGLNNVGVGYSAAHTATLQGISILSGGQGGGVQINREDGSNPSSGESLGSYAFKGTDSANTNAAADAMIAAEASQNHSGTAAGAELQFFTKPDDTGPGSAPSRRMTIRNDGGVAIGLNNDGFSTQILSVKAGNNDEVLFGESDDANCFASFRDNSSTANIEFGATADAHILRSDTTVRIRVDSDGLKFGSDTAAANALDDYEIGTWTPVIIGSTTNPVYTTSAAVGDYIKIGDIVHANFLIIVTGVSNVGAGNKSVDGLPFTNNQNAYQQIGLIGYNDVWTEAVTRFYITGGNLTIMPSGVTQSNFTGDVTTGYFAGQITYSTSD